MKRFFCVTILVLAVSGCSLTAPPASPSPAASAPADRLAVVTTFYPWAFFAQRIGGDLANVVSIVPPGTEPHDFEPTPRDIAAARSARIFLYNGAGIDGWAEKTASDLANDPVVTLRAADSTPLLEAVEDGHASEEEHAVFDPHFWLDPVAVRGVIDRIELAFLTIDRPNEATYRANAERVRADLDALDAQYRTGLQACRIRTAVTGHAAFAYLAKRYDFTQTPIAGLSPEVEPSLSRLRELTDTIRSLGIRFVFFETLASPKVAQTLARETGASPLVFNPLEGLTNEEAARGEDYFSIMRQNLDNLRRGMECP